MHISDWHPTILNLAGEDASGLDGVDQTRMVLKGRRSARKEIIYQIDSTFPQFMGAEAIRVGKYKLIRGFPGLYDGYESDGSLGLTHEVDLINGKRSNLTLSAATMQAIKRSSYEFDWEAIAQYINEVKDVVQLYNVVRK